MRKKRFVYKYSESKNIRKNCEHSFPDINDYPQNKKINFVIFYNDLYIPLNSNILGPFFIQNLVVDKK